MRSKPVVKIVLLAVLWLAGGLVAEAQIGNLMQRAKKSVSSKTETKVKNLLDGEKAVQEAGLKTMGEMGGGKSYYVSREKGSARAEGTKESPMKDIQKAIDQASDGDVIRIARGNYLGNLDRGWIEIKGKYVSLEGGWNDDFTERNPTKYITRIQPTVEQRGTIGQGLLMMEATANRHGRMVIDGLFFDLGLVHEYAKADPTDDRFGCPEGCETG